jgi:predicted ATP-dependent serine protease
MATSDPCTVCGERAQSAAGKCKRCYMREYMRTYRATHPEYVARQRIRSHAYNQAHRDKWLESKRKANNNCRHALSNAQVLEVMGCR